MAYEFNGTDQRLTIGSSPVSGFPTTIAAWVRPTSLVGDKVPVSIYSSTDSDRIALRILGAAPGVYTINDGISAGIATSGTASINTWGHLAGVFSATNSRIAYWNAAAGATNTTNITGLTAFNRIVVGCTFGGVNNSLVGSFFLGDIAEVGIWNAALTAAEIASLAKGMTCDKVRPQNLVFYAPLVRDLNDQKGGLTITNNNAATVATHPRVYA